MKLVFIVQVLNEHHEHCIEFQGQQMLHDGVRRWFESMTRAGMRPSEALTLYENFVLYDRAIQAVFNDARVRLCYWHAIEAWRRWLVKGVNGVADKGTQQTIFEV